MKTKEDLQADIHPLLQQRWSPRSFRSEPIDQGTIDRLFEAARWAPSSFNEQPWRFIYATQSDGSAYEDLQGCLNEFNQKWASNAYLLIVGIVKTTFTKNGKENRHAGHDLGQAIAHMTFQATEEGLFVHQMGGFSAEKVRETYGVGDGFQPMTAIAVGHKGEPGDLPEDMQKGEKANQKRHSPDQWLFRGEWPD